MLQKVTASGRVSLDPAMVAFPTADNVQKCWLAKRPLPDIFELTPCRGPDP